MKYPLTKMILSALLVSLLGSCDNSVSSTNEPKTEKQNTIESDGCNDSDIINPVSPLDPVKVEGCPIN